VSRAIYIQIIDNPFQDIIYSDLYYDNGATNQAIAEHLQYSLDYYYPNMVYVEYIDLFLEDEERFPEIREMFSFGLITPPVILINGKAIFHGGISYRIIIEEIDRMLSSGPLH
jgi:disulfide oxidoreductase YuzD